MMKQLYKDPGTGAGKLVGRDAEARGSWELTGETT